jgi:hypothetical protein
MFGPGTFGSETVTALSLIGGDIWGLRRASRCRTILASTLPLGSCSRNETRMSSLTATMATQVRSVLITPMSIANHRV